MSLSINRIVGSVVGKAPQNVTTGDKVRVGVGAAFTAPIWAGPVALVAVTSAFGAGCNGSNSGPTPVEILDDGGVVPLTDDGGFKPPFGKTDAGEPTDGPAPTDGPEEPAVVVPGGVPVDVTGDRFQEQPQITFTIYLVGGSGLSGMPLLLRTVANPSKIDPLFSTPANCKRGMYDVTMGPNGYIADPSDDGNHIPVTMIADYLQDNNTSPATVVGPINQSVDPGAFCNDGSSDGTAILDQIPLSFNQPGTLDTGYQFSLGLDGSQFVPGHSYDYRLDFAILKDTSTRSARSHNTLSAVSMRVSFQVTEDPAHPGNANKYRAIGGITFERINLKAVQE